MYEVDKSVFDMKIQLHLNYQTQWGQRICVSGTTSVLGDRDVEKAHEMVCIASDRWFLEVDIEQEGLLEYNYVVKEGEQVVRNEHRIPHLLLLMKGESYIVNDHWYEVPQQKYFDSSAFTDVFFAHSSQPTFQQYPGALLFSVYCPYASAEQEVTLCGSISMLGDWVPEAALPMHYLGQGIWQLSINRQQLNSGFSYKLLIRDKKSKAAIHWEDAENRYLNDLLLLTVQHTTCVVSLTYACKGLFWKTAGVAIPVFSLRSEDSFGVGDFLDLKKLVDWSKLTGLKVIQLLPINDTTITRTWLDSYPYKAISTYALHPLYLNLKSLPLNDRVKAEAYTREAAELNALSAVDYEKALALKERYIADLYTEQGSKVCKTKGYQTFYTQNEYWLFPYACFSYLRDKYGTLNWRLWGEHVTYDESRLKELIAADKQADLGVKGYFFTQYLLHIQLSESRDYAHQEGVILKGDIPIGIHSQSVEAWIEPHLFNLDVQTGAPPDDFSVYGQNWGFPTYNWDEMAKDGYRWWKQRFRKMADYFDAYRIDHILGFFRIWEIPISSVQGLLGYFSPALPYTEDELRGRGLRLDIERMTSPYIHEQYLYEIFGKHKQEVIHAYMHSIAYGRYELNATCNTQEKIQKLFQGKTDSKSMEIRDGLFSLCNEVLFVRDKREPQKLHPRITAQFTYSYKDLSEKDQEIYNRLYDHFFYERHDWFWKESAMQKLPDIIDATRMLVCGEDLGMIPNCVPEVMHDLQILSLEIERMPKVKELLFTPLYQIPYASVCTTSTHDMSTIRLWWEENKALTQQYYNEVLWKTGEAPEQCSGELCRQIIVNHLSSPAMLAILPLQDWLSFDENIRNPDVKAERINIPAEAQHYWQYKMHFTLEDLLEAAQTNREISRMVSASGR